MQPISLISTPILSTLLFLLLSHPLPAHAALNFTPVFTPGELGYPCIRIPSILLAIALMALIGASVQNVVIAISIAEIPRVARLVRGVVLSLREQAYVEAAIASGTRIPKIIWKHILPNTLAPLTVQATFICASAMLAEATLSFIGAGTPPTIPSWGNIMAEGRALWQVKPFIVFFPANFLSLTVLSVNLLGDGLRDALDPRLAKRI